MIHEQIDNIIKTKVNPVLADHFGSATLTKYENKIAYVKLNGMCASCPSAQDTLELTIKKIILKELPEVSDVKLDTSVSEDILDMEEKYLIYKIKEENKMLMTGKEYIESLRKLNTRYICSEKN